ncbi:UvrD-helicase domain-containing protein [Nocardia sp. NPDC059228]|uniref:UvrD-helicase domain-containing protein n=1 Tax=Nocardia sp. NPDC059228 TaxID=3346777 RepID=UPI0036A7D92D
MPDSERTFTPEQLRLIDGTGSQYVLACPGAGKTQAIAERYVRRPNHHPRKGMALLSFTNAAADEAAVRCSSKPDLLLCPNFVGTIDKFINRFIVSPVWTSQKEMAPRFIDVWSQLPHTSVKSKDFWASLDWFTFDRSGAAQLSRHSIPSEHRTKFDKLPVWQVRSFEQQAETIRRNYISKGYLSAEASRKIALDYIDDSELRKSLTKILIHRFFEVVVDEVQDCSDEDVQILELIENSGIHLVLVGDPDQAIYEFRGRSENAARRLELLAPLGERLNGNFRSTPAICSAANSLRASNETDISVGRNRDINTPILLLKYDKPPAVAAAKTKVAEAYGIVNEDCIVLAHGRRQAASCAGGSAAELVSEARLARIAIAVEALQSTSNEGSKRRDALKNLTVCLHEASHDAYNQLATHEFYDAIGLSEREYLAKVLRLAHAVNFDRALAPSEFKACLVSSLQEHDFHWVRAGAIQKPKLDKWSNLPSAKQPIFEFSTIHNYKGLQRKFVTVIVPDNKDKWQPHETGVGQWLAGLEGEARRVLYVGATRAEELLMLAVHDSEYDGVYQRLITDEVPFDVVDPTTGRGLGASNQLF